MQTLQAVAVADIQVSKSNPRKAFNPERMKELTASILEKGVLEPVIVRPISGNLFELVCGHRRLAAAKNAGLTEIPAVVRSLSDEDALEFQLIENLQREDLHPLEEAAGYQQLIARAKYDVAKIAAKIGRSAKYVYDRVKLLQLTPEAKQAFLEDRIQAGHAILLARLKPEDQKRAMDDEKGGVFEHEGTLWNPDEGGRYAGRNGHEDLKARTVRELQGWIDQHVRFDWQGKDVPDLFPETAAAVADVAGGGDRKRKVIAITWEHYVQPAARGEGRIYGPRSWKRADGEEARDDMGRKIKSKTCDKSGLGVIVAGPGRGDAFEVCVNRTCEVHFPQTAGKAKKKAKSAGDGGRAAEQREAESWKKQEQQRREAQQKRQERWNRFVKARPKILEAIADFVKKAPAGASGPLARVLVLAMNLTPGSGKNALVPAGRTAEDLVRHLAFREVEHLAGDAWAFDRFSVRVKELGIDIGKLLNEHAPAKPTAARKAKKS
jgi:ParB/RepB/Spo0J family partition protein